jgi:hypothetical protein
VELWRVAKNFLENMSLWSIPLWAGVRFTSGVYSASGVSAAVAGKNQGSVIMTGDRGTILNCEYISSGGHGTGACEDKRGTKYKLMF